jgi:hypothetical protein
MPRNKTPDEIAAANDETTRTSLEMMEELLEIGHREIEILSDIAAMLQEAIDGEELDE